MSLNYQKLKIWNFVFLIFLVIIVDAIPLQSMASPIQNLLRNRIESGGVPLKLRIGDESVYASVALPTFYERRAYRPAWVNEKGPLLQTKSFLNAIQEAEAEGLRPQDYHLDKIKHLLSEMRQTPKIYKSPNPRLLVDLDLLLTDAFLILGSHLVSGRINPERIDPQWFVSRREADLLQVLEEALASAEIEKALKSLLPLHGGYERLRKVLALYRKIAENGGWPNVPEGPKIQKGDRSDHISILRQRLAAEGFIDNPASIASPIFDDQLDQALKKFQIQNGLEPDGVLGKQTIKTLNITTDERLRQIIVNMERWRWLPQDLGSRYILVNIAGFYLNVIENQKPLMDMRVVAGKPYRRTPVFSDKITYLVLNPYWAVPKTIAEKDILPKVKKDPAFLENQKFKIFQGWGADTQEIDPRTVDWQAVTAADLKLRFRQDPGPQNALGRVKFMFPNQFDVYLHDTPSRELFAKARRDFSSGCIRVEKPLELAEYLLRNESDWPSEKIRLALMGDESVETTVKLPEPVNIHILYWTVWVGKDDLIHFGADIYDRDKALHEALQEPPPGA
ncbi:MAG: L,D-transpeptidase family protein [Desulfobacterales bacterium]|jgi:murein L,D-transpeptidase YcbB/YkuD